MQLEDPAEATESAAHDVHVDTLVAAIELLALPIGQSVHDDNPSDLPYEPAGHAMQSDALAPPMSGFAVPLMQN